MDTNCRPHAPAATTTTAGSSRWHPLPRSAGESRKSVAGPVGGVTWIVRPWSPRWQDLFNPGACLRGACAGHACVKSSVRCNGGGLRL